MSKPVKQPNLITIDTTNTIRSEEYNLKIDFKNKF